MTVVLGSDHKRGFHQQGGPKELPEGCQLRELMGMVVETRDWGYQRRWSPWASMIDDPHTTLIIPQLHMPIVQKANHTNHLRRYPKPRR